MKYFATILTLLTLCSCATEVVERGVSRELADSRKENISHLEYSLRFDIPDTLSKPVTGNVEVSFVLGDKSSIVLDYMNPDSTSITSVVVNGSRAKYKFANEHIVIPASQSNVGANSVKVEFRASDQSLNRREKFLYSLLVPDRARTLFPCFDQPNLKARFTVEMTVPDGWTAVSNGAVTRQEESTIKFAQTEPLSTYLFSIVAGELDCITRKRGDRSISLYHRETDSEKLAQTDTIFSQVFASLEWLEDYTGIKYPFAKYDLIILPGFQYGGMEHTGATLYSDKKMFLSPGATLGEELSRSSLIAHETAHMWFGDYVTMDWFSDVWTKEVFANYFASQIVAPQFPAVNHELNFMLSYAPSAYAEDRTSGSNPIQQDLDNLRDAGLVYGNIIYKKSPMVMNMLVTTVGKENFRKGIQTYLQKYAYANATWDDLIEILDELTDIDLLAWSDAWVKQKGMPTIEIKDGQVVQSDPFGRGVIWGQPLEILTDNGVKTSVVLDSASVAIPLKEAYYIPNSDGRGYGFFKLDTVTAEYCMANLARISDDVTRGSLLITLYENMLNGTIAPDSFMKTMVEYLPKEKNQLLFAEAIGYAQTCNQRYAPSEKFEQTLWSIYDNKPQYSLIALRALMSAARSSGSLERLYTLWNDGKLSERDAISLSYQLAVRMPDRADAIVATQLSRITNPDRRAEYLFISPAVSHAQQTRDSVFKSLLMVENRGVEPWVQSSLSLLNHPLRQAESLAYIRAGLDEVSEVQQTGDIFFPAGWCGSLLGGHNSHQAAAIVEQFFADNPTYPKKLTSKIRQRSDHLTRIR